MNKEIKIKKERLLKFLAKKKLYGYLITRRDNFAWMTGGKSNHVLLSVDEGLSSVLITKKKNYLLANNIEIDRVKEEELSKQGFVSAGFYWFDESRRGEIIRKLTKGSKIGSDNGEAGTKAISIADIQHPLLQVEIERYKQLGKKTSACLGEGCRRIKPGQTEHQVAGMLAGKLLDLGIEPIVLLIAADDRIYKYRHPIPTDKKIKKYVMIVVCARRCGLIVSITRLVHFGKLSNELRNKHNAVVKVDASFILNSKPKMELGSIFKKAQCMYAQTGFKNEWKLHHQGGPTGYMPREYVATLESCEILEANRALAWNPSITGTKSEDTIITQNGRPIIITETPNWPMLDVKIPEGRIKRPDILIR